MIEAVGSPASWLVSRIDKLDHYQTVLYEIDMLRFAHRKMLPLWQEAQEGDVWVYLESFLVHYRNLLDFFGKKPSRKRNRKRDKTDLTVWRPQVIWSSESGLEARRPSQDDLETMRKEGHDLWKKYEDPDKADTISRYLQHCTTYRTGFKTWHPDEMMFDINGILERFEKHLPEFKPATRSELLLFRRAERSAAGGTFGGNSTASYSLGESVMLPEDATSVKHREPGK